MTPGSETPRVAAGEHVTRSSVSADSGLDWAHPGAWEVVPAVYRIPLPLATDGLRAVNVYAIAGADGITMIDGGWAIEGAIEALTDALAMIGYGLGDIRRFLVTHIHRDHYTLASVIADRTGAEINLGAAEKPTLDFIHDPARMTRAAFTQTFIEAGTPEIAFRWEDLEDIPDLAHWRAPDRWLVEDERIDIADRTLTVRATPGHTPGHIVFVDSDAGVVFSGDHLLPTITPSVGFVVPTPADPLRDFLDSLVAMRELGDMRILPAHGPVGMSSAERAQELLDHHDVRLQEVRGVLTSHPMSAYAVAERLRWTRRGLEFGELDIFNRGLAVIEARAHLNYLVGSGLLERGSQQEATEYRSI